MNNAGGKEPDNEAATEGVKNPLDVSHPPYHSGTPQAVALAASNHNQLDFSL